MAQNTEKRPDMDPFVKMESLAKEEKDIQSPQLAP